jgi:predicted DsbA family dithiol-disulfide isomerase
MRPLDPDCIRTCRRFLVKNSGIAKRVRTFPEKEVDCHPKQEASARLTLDLGRERLLPDFHDRRRLMQLTYFFDVCSMWCALGDEVVTEVCQRYGTRVPVTWKIALINGGKPMEAGPEQELWYYDRCEIVTGRRFNHRWLESRQQSTVIPNSLIAAAWRFGKGKPVHEALKSAAMERGEPILQRAVALKLASEASGIAQETLASTIDDPSLASELEESLLEFESYQIDQRPAFILRSAIGDTAVFSGVYRGGPIFAALSTMLQDEEKYAEHASSHPPIPD